MSSTRHRIRPTKPLAAAACDLDALFAGAGAADHVLPRRLVTGDGALERLGASLADLGVPSGPVLVVADAFLAGNGTGDTAAEALRTAGYEPALYGAIGGEPDLDAVERVVAAARGSAYVAVVGLGGGSALDPAKLAAALATNDGPVEEYVRGARPLARPPLPFALVPTTAGTGAEASRNAIVAHAGRKFVVSDPLLAPSLALLDPLLTATCPAAVTAASGMDALAHAVEAALSTWATPFTTLNALAAVRSVAASLRAAVADGGDLSARRALLVAAHLAGLALNASTGLGHSIAYTIAARTHLPHGVTTAIALPYCVAYGGAAAAPQVRLLAREAGADERSFAAWLRALAADVGIPGSLAEVGIDEAELPAMADECLAFYPRPNNPLPLERGRLLVLLQHLHAGDLPGAVEAMA